MQKLNLPTYNFRLNENQGKNYIFDVIRKKFILLTPEEWVRQNFIQYLVHEKNYSQSLMAVEKKVTVNDKIFRFDLLIHDRKGKPGLIAEFKAPEVRIDQKSFDQVVRYNMALRVKHVVVSNGLKHFACEIDYDNNSYEFLKDIPEFGLKQGG